MSKIPIDYVDGGIGHSATKFVAADARAIAQKVNWLYEKEDNPDNLTAGSVSTAYAVTAVSYAPGAVASSIPGAIIAADMGVVADRSGKVSLLGAKPTPFGQPGTACYAPNWCAHNDGTSGSVNWATSAWGLDFWVDGTTSVEFACYTMFASGYSPGLDVWIDDRKLSINPLTISTSTLSANALNTFKINFGSVGRHRVRLHMDFLAIGKIWVSSTGTIWPAHIGGPRVIILGDSWAGYVTNSGYGAGGWPRYCMNILGWRDWWDAAIPGTGPNTPVGGFPNYKSRVTSDVVPSGADVVIIGTVGNDMFAGRTATQIASDVTTLITACNGMATKPFVLVYSGTPDATNATIDNALQTACAAGGAAFQSGWFGTLYDRSGALIRTETPFITAANRASYIPGGDIHLNDNGAAYIGNRMASTLMAGLKAA